MKVRDLTLTGVLCALAIALSAVEWQFPPLIPALPGARLGLANVVVLFCLYAQDVKKAMAVVVLRSLASALFMRGMAALLYSLAGGAAGLAVMWLLKQAGERISIAGVSVAGAVTFNAAQLAVGAAVIADWHIFYYLPLMTLFSIVSGLITGIIAKYSIKHFKEFKLWN